MAAPKIPTPITIIRPILRRSLMFSFQKSTVGNKARTKSAKALNALKLSEPYPPSALRE